MHIKTILPYTLIALLFGLIIGQTLEISKLSHTVSHMQREVQLLEDEQAGLRQRNEEERTLPYPTDEVILI